MPIRLQDYENSLRPKPMGVFSLLGDIALKPVMWLLGGFDADKIQGMHAWNCQYINPDLITEELTVSVEPADGRMRRRYSFLFHAPIFGGWSSYQALDVEGDGSFHIGWIVRDPSTGELKQACVSRLASEQGPVRMLRGPALLSTTFFAVNPSGRQLPLRSVGTGVLGDRQFPGSRLL